MEICIAAFVSEFYNYFIFTKENTLICTNHELQWKQIKMKEALTSYLKISYQGKLIFDQAETSCHQAIIYLPSDQESFIPVLLSWKSSWYACHHGNSKTSCKHPKFQLKVLMMHISTFCCVLTLWHTLAWKITFSSLLPIIFILKFYFKSGIWIGSTCKCPISSRYLILQPFLIFTWPFDVQKWSIDGLNWYDVKNRETWTNSPKGEASWLQTVWKVFQQSSKFEETFTNPHWREALWMQTVWQLL